MSEKKNISNDQLVSELSNKRAAGKGGKVLEGFGVVIVLIGFLTTLIPLAVLGVLLCLIGVLVMNHGEKGVQQQIGEQLVRGLLEETFEQVEYNPAGHISSSDMGRVKATIEAEFNQVDGSHHVKARYKGNSVEMSGVSLIQEEDYYNDDAGIWETIRKTVFEGQLLVCDFGKELSAEMRIITRSGLNRLFPGAVVKTDHEEFDRRFYVKSELEQKVRYILTPQVIEHILAMSAKYGGKIYLSFWQDGKLYLVIDTRQPFFSVGRGKVDADLLKQRYAEEIRWFTDFIDKLGRIDTFYQSGV